TNFKSARTLRANHSSPLPSDSRRRRSCSFMAIHSRSNGCAPGSRQICRIRKSSCQRLASTLNCNGVRVVSWNINSLRKRQDRLFEWLESTKPDIVCLQETKCTDEQFPALALQAVGSHSAYHGEKSYSGVAILSKTTLRDVRASLCDEIVDPEARVIAARIDNLRVYSIYAPNGQAVGSPAYEYKLNWYARLRDCLTKEKDLDLVVCGDFNVAPDDGDVHEPALWHGAIMCSDGE